MPTLIDPIRVTGGSAANDQLLYFTSPSLLSDDRRLVFLSDRLDGNPNLFVRDLVTGEERALTSQREGMLKSYVYFDGRPYRGFGKASVSVHAGSGAIYYIQGREIRALDIAGRERVLAEYPAGQMTAFTHVSADGTRLCVPTVDARALDDDRLLPGKPAYNIDARVQAEHLCSYLRVYDTGTGEQLACEPVRDAWITHVQFSPLDHDTILYNHEWPSHSPGSRRMWLWNGNEHRCLRPSGPDSNPDDWACHEMWERDGRAIIYHGSHQATGAAFVGRVRPDGSERVEITLPLGWKRYGHFTEGGPGLLVSDGYYEQPDDAPPEGWGRAWISLLHANWAGRRIDWRPLCRSGSSWTSQDEHPHPIFNHAANAVYFTSDKSGARAIYRVPVPAH